MSFEKVKEHAALLGHEIAKSIEKALENMEKEKIKELDWFAGNGNQEYMKK